VSGTTVEYVKAIDWLTDLGDLSGLKLTMRDSTEAAIPFSVIGKRLRSLKVGDAEKTSDEILFNAETLTVAGEAIEEIDARNASSIRGKLDLQKCPRTREVYTSGTSLTSVIPPVGGRVTTLQLPDTLQDLVLVNLNLLQPEGLEISDTALANIRGLYVNSCQHINPIQLLQRIYDTPNNKLTGIGLVWKGWLVDEDGSALHMFGKIAEKAGIDGGYSGVDFTTDTTTTALPNISGALDASGLSGVYLEDIQAIQAKLPSLQLKYNADKLYIRFSDDEVLNVLLANITTDDGIGLKVSDVEGLTTMGDWFNTNEAIVSFNELVRFTGLTELAAATFRKCSKLESITLPPNVTSTSVNLFLDCVALKSVTTVNPVKILETQTFRGCSSLESFDTSELEEMRNTATGCGVFINTAIKVFNAPKLKTLGTTWYTAHFMGTPIERVESLGSITTLPTGNGNYAVFKQCNSLQYVNLPSSLTFIGAYTFYACTALTTINIPESVTTIETMAFNGCTSLSLEELNLPNLTSLGQNAFYGVKIKKMVLGKEGGTLTLPAGSTATQNYGDKSVLEEIEFNGATSIPAGTLLGYTALKECVLHEGVTSIQGTGLGNGGAFYNCTALETVELPSSVTTLGNGAFGLCSNLKNIGNMSNITTIGNSTFEKCTALNIDVDLPSLTSIGLPAFKDTGITKVLNLGQITTIAAAPLYNTGVFYNCPNLEFVVLPASLEVLGKSSFGNNPKLTTVLCYATTPPDMSSGIAFNSSDNAIIYVPDASVEAYKGATNWSSYADRIKPLNEYDGVIPDAPQTPTYEQITSNYTLETGQAYGKVGGSIQFTDDTAYQHTKAAISDVSYVMVKAPSQASSLVQYVDGNDKILQIAVTNFPSSLTRYNIGNIEGATHVYITSAAGTMQIWKEVEQ
jgi:hypothetical protein